MPDEKPYLCPICSNNSENQVCKIYPDKKGFQWECDGFRLQKKQTVKIGEKVPLSHINQFLGYN